MTEAVGINDVLDGPIRKFNPGTFQSDEEVIRQFVVRQRELDVVLEVLHDNIDAPSCQHVLVVAPRGRGKTMLLARVCAELRTDDTLSKQLFPVRFMEESQEISTLSDFWLEALFYLAHASADADREFSRELLATHADLATRWRDTHIEAQAHAAVLAAADRVGKTLVLMVENLQALCNDVDTDFGWQLRKTLQTEPRIVLLATATSHFKGLDDATQPFFELFRVINLKPLDTDACRRLWSMVSGDMRKRREIQPLRILTGGCPRLLVIVATFGQHRSLRHLLGDLVSLVDDHTEYFRGHLEVIAKTERRVYLAVLDLWQPSSPSEIALRARMDIRAVSALLGRLVDRGAVLVDGKGRKRRYSAAARLYCIYYKLRRERDEATLVQYLVQFMVVFYSDDEWSELADTLLFEARQEPVIRKGMERALIAGVQVGNGFGAGNKPEVQKMLAKALLDKGIMHGQRGESRAELDVYDELVARFGDSDSPELQKQVAIALLNKGVTHGQRGESKAELDVYDELIARFGDSDALELLERVAKALFNKGLSHGQSGESGAALEAYDDLIGRFEDSDAPRLQVQVTRALLNKGVTHGQRGESQTELDVYDELIGRIGDSDVLEFLEQVAKALINKGITHGQRGESQAELDAYDELLGRFGDSDAPELSEPVAKALLNKGVAHGQRGESQAELDAYDELVARFGDSDALELLERVAKALLNKGITHGQRGESEAELDTYDELVARFGDSDARALLEQVAMALVNKGLTHGQRAEPEAALEIYDDLVARFGDSDAPELSEPVAKALLNKGVAHGQRGESQAELDAYDELVARFGDSDALELLERVAKALLNKGITHGQRGESTAELDVYDELVARFADSDAPALLEQVAKALVNKGRTHGQRGEPEAALGIYDDLVARFGDSDAPALLEQVAKALFNKGLTHGQLGESAAELDVYDDLVARFGDSDIPELQVLVAAALVAQGDRQIAIGRAEQALRTGDEIERRFGAFRENERIVFALWRAMLMRMHALLVQNDRPAALGVFRSVCSMFVADKVMMLNEMLVRVPALIAAGASARELHEILSEDSKTADALAPLVVALRQMAGESVRAPGEVLEVAADVRKRIEDWSRTTQS